MPGRSLRHLATLLVLVVCVRGTARAEAVLDLRGGPGTRAVITLPASTAVPVASAASPARRAEVAAASPTPEFVFIGAQANEQAGFAVATAGDVDGDGYSDLLVGSPTWSNDQFAEGRVQLFRGGPGGFATTPAWSYESDSTLAFLGCAVAPAGDVNGDGYADVIVGAKGYASVGRAYVFLGGPAGLSASPVWSILGDETGGLLGYSVAAAGDVNGDGFDDVLVGAPEHASFGYFRGGVAYVFHGGPLGTQAPAATTLGTIGANQFNGQALAGAGDVDGDGFDDVVIAQPGSSGWGGVANGGAVKVYRGGPAGVSLSAYATWLGDQANETFGASVAILGDVNGDGYADVAVGSPGWHGVVTDQGRVQVFEFGASGAPAVAAFEVDGLYPNVSTPGGRFGTKLAPAGDVNGDGFADLIVGAPFYPGPGNQPNAGIAIVYECSSHGAAYAWDAWGAGGGELGLAVCAAGDGNADGFGDLVVGEPNWLSTGRALVFHGAGDMPQVSPGTRYQGTTARFIPAGDLNGDGFDDAVQWQSASDGPDPTLDIAFGSEGGLFSTASQVIPVGSVNGDVSTDQGFGIGDINGDGFVDLLAHTVSSGGSTGSWVILPGGVLGVGSTPLWSMADSPDSSLSCTSAGDVNGDGYADLAIVRPNRVEIRLGSAAGPLATPAWMLASPDGSINIFPAGDTNGDGFGDVVVNEAQWTETSSHQGRLRLFLGTASSVASTAALTMLGSTTNAQLQFESVLGDVDGDGRSDFSCGESWPSAPHRIVYGAGSLPVQSISQPSPTTSYLWISAAGDLDLDGHSDVYVQGDDNTAPRSGIALWALRGTAAGIDTTRAWESAPFTGGYVIVTNDRASDFNGDGLPDLLLSTAILAGSPEVQVYYGGGARTGAKGRARAPGQWQSDLSAPIATSGVSGATNAFGLYVPQVHSPAGRTRVRLESEVHPYGTAFAPGSRVATPWFATSAPQPDVGSDFEGLTQVRNGLTANSRYVWRTRIASHTPYLPWSPWFSPIDNGRAEADLRTHGTTTSVTPLVATGERAVLAAPSPNPSRGERVLRFALPAAGEAALDVLDVSGRLVRSVTHGAFAAGAHDARWDGRDASGRAVAEGVYFARLQTTRGVEQRKLVVIR